MWENIGGLDIGVRIVGLCWDGDGGVMGGWKEGGGDYSTALP